MSTPRRSGVLSVSTLGGAAPDTIIGRAAADRAGARPYRAHVAKTRRNVPRRIARERVPTSRNALSEIFGDESAIEHVIRGDALSANVGLKFNNNSLESL